MYKRNLMALAFAALAASGLQAAEPVAEAKTEAAALMLSPDEQTFAGKLSEGARKIFNQMTAEQRKAAMTAATDPALGADGAVDKVVNQASACKAAK